MATIHISEAEAARDLSGLIAKVRAGDEFVIGDAAPPVKLSMISTQRGRLLSESIALAEAHAKATGIAPEMDAAFVADMKQIISNRKPRDISAWG